MIGLISKEYSDKQQLEAQERQLRKSIAVKLSKYEESSDNPTDNFTELFVHGQKLRVAAEEITITGELAGSNAESSRDVGCSILAEKRECGMHTQLRNSPVETSPRIDSALKVAQQMSRNCQNDTKLDIEGIEDNIPLKLKTIDLVPEKARQIQIDIVLEQEPQNRHSHNTEGELDHESEGFGGVERRGSVTLDSDCDYSSRQPGTTEVLFDDEIVVLNGEHLNSITRFHLDQTFQPSNVKTWGSKLVAKRCMLSAKQGDGRAQFRLGCMYAMGMGVQQNYVMAYTWIKVSASQHSSKATVKLKEIETSLTTAHIAYATQLAAQYYAMYVAPYLTSK